MCEIVLLHQGKLAGVEDLDCHDKGFEEHVMELLSSVMRPGKDFVNE